MTDDQKYLDACAIAAMQSYLITAGHDKYVVGMAHDCAAEMLAERNKRMQAEAKPSIDKLLLLLREAEIALVPNNAAQPLRDEINRVLEASK